MRALLLMGLLVLMQSPALAQPGGESASALRVEFIALDRNRDGQISKVEALSNPEIHKRFSSFDRAATR